MGVDVGRIALWSHKKDKNSNIFLNGGKRSLNYRPGNGPKTNSQERVAIVENFRIMNLWFVCLIDKSLSIFLGSSTILHPCGYRLVRDSVPAVPGLRPLDCTAWSTPRHIFPSEEKLSVG